MAAMAAQPLCATAAKPATMTRGFRAAAGSRAARLAPAWRASLVGSSPAGALLSASGRGTARAAVARRRTAPPAASALVAAASSGDASKPAAATPAAAATAYSPQFVRHRIGVFLSILLGYACYYLTRNSLTFTAPVMVATPSLGLTITDIGVITSIFPLCYGCSKFVSGVVGDVLSPGVMLGSGLFLTGLVNCAFGASSSMPLFCTLWALNGILQGWGAPACAKILTAWFATGERGTYWGMWNIAHNLGGFSAPILAGTAARALGWQWGLWAPGLIGVVVGLLIFSTLKDSPEAAGFPPVEDAATAAAAAAAKKAAKNGPDDGTPQLSLLQNLRQNVLSNPYIWGLALTYFCVYIVRQGITSWSVFYLIKEKGVADAGQAALRVSGLEIGGLLGSLVAGRVSDAAIARGGPGGAVGKRVKVVMAYLVGVAVTLAAFRASPPGVGWLQTLTVFFIGFFLYGPQMLIGLCGAEIVGRRSVGASEGFLGWVAYLGAANAGVPLSLLVQRYGWDAFFATMIGASGVALLLLMPLMNAKSFVQRDADAIKRLQAAANA